MFAFWLVLNSKPLFPAYPFSCRMKMGRDRFRVWLTKEFLSFFCGFFKYLKKNKIKEAAHGQALHFACK